MIRTAGMLALFGMNGLTIRKAVGDTTTILTPTPSETEGPYWIDEKLNRADLALDPTDSSVQLGFPLVLNVTVSQLVDGALQPIPNAYVDLWHCNAQGIYSDMAAQNTTGKKFLRGYQVTDSNGFAQYLTIYPGWYSGRTVHVHSRVRIFSGDQTTTNFTTQLFFDDSVTDQVFQLAPYNQRPNRDTINTADSIYNGTDCLTNKAAGSETALVLSTDSAHAVGTFNIVLDLSGSSTACSTVGGSGGNPGGPGGPPPARFGG
jgi:protocatechuate 3,4-dioxygenase beta subunit